MKKHPDIEKVLFTPAQIQQGVQRLARAIEADFKGRDLVLISILKGSVIFLSDLLRSLELPCTVDFMAVSSYGAGAESSGVVRLIMDLRESPEGKDLLLIEDILDTGLTVQYLLENLATRRPRSVKICAFLDKSGNRRVPVRADYRCFEIPNDFVVGYGLDYAEKYRNLPYVGVLRKTIYNEPGPGLAAPELSRMKENEK